MGFDQQLQQNVQNPKVSPPSRIEQDVEEIKRLINSVERTTERIIRHARSLGYYEPTPQPGGAAPTPVIISLAEALKALDRAVDHCSGSLNVFD